MVQNTVWFLLLKQISLKLSNLTYFKCKWQFSWRFNPSFFNTGKPTWNCNNCVKPLLLLNKFAILLKSINRYQQLQVAAAHPTSKWPWGLQRKYKKSYCTWFFAVEQFSQFAEFYICRFLKIVLVNF